MLHPLDCTTVPPLMNNPFDYTPCPAAVEAMDRLSRLLRGETVCAGGKAVACTGGSAATTDCNEDAAFTSLPAEFRAEAAQGKMFGVVIVRVGERLHAIYGYGGQICGRSDWRGFAPAVYDYLQPDGHFKRTEARISAINREIADMENSNAMRDAEARCADIAQQRDVVLAAQREAMARRKAQRDALRRSFAAHADVAKRGVDTQNKEEETKPMAMDAQRIAAETQRIAAETQRIAAETQRMIAESQHDKAELRRIKRYWAARMEEAEAALRAIKDEVEALRQRRRTMSDALQAWLFDQFRLRNALGEEAPLRTVYSQGIAAMRGLPMAETARMLPPSGTGECCEPRLLQAAYRLGLRPLAMAMMWWGCSPREEVRHEGRFYPACRAKCGPVLPWMLRGLDVEMPKSMVSDGLKIIYEDQHMAVVDKPSGLLSVPGRGCGDSVEAIMRRRWGKESASQTAKNNKETPLQKDKEAPQNNKGATLQAHKEAVKSDKEAPQNNNDAAASHPIIVHRLDMDTSGLMVVARTDEAYHALQRQFLAHTVRKRYEALLEHEPPQPSGVIDLPLRPDLDDRPRQVADPVHGRRAVTRYEVIAGRRVSLWPVTGRTHQLRVHCAHALGLASPISGDPLYGTGAMAHDGSRRLCLHAADLWLMHPATGQEMHFCSKVPF